MIPAPVEYVYSFADAYAGRGPLQPILQYPEHAKGSHCLRRVLSSAHRLCLYHTAPHLVVLREKLNFAVQVSCARGPDGDSSILLLAPNPLAHCRAALASHPKYPPWARSIYTPFRFQKHPLLFHSLGSFPPLCSLTASARAPPAPAVGAGGRGTGRRAVYGGGGRPEVRREHFPRPGSGGPVGRRSAPVGPGHGVRQGDGARLAGATTGRPAGGPSEASFFQDRGRREAVSENLSPGRPAARTHLPPRLPSRPLQHEIGASATGTSCARAPTARVALLGHFRPCDPKN